MILKYGRSRNDWSSIVVWFVDPVGTTTNGVAILAVKPGLNKTAQPSQITDLKEGQRYLVTLTIRAPPSLLSDSILLQTLDSYVWIDI